MINGSNLLSKVKAELRITGTDDDVRLVGLIEEAAFYLQKFKEKILVDSVSDAATQALLSPLDQRFVSVYVGIQYDGADLKEAMERLTELVREK